MARAFFVLAMILRGGKREWKESDFLPDFAAPETPRMKTADLKAVFANVAAALRRRNADVGKTSPKKATP